MQDPINAELVQQLEEYLDADALAELKQAEAEAKQAQNAAENKSQGGADSGSASSDNGSSRPSSSGSGSSAPAFTGNIMDDFGEDELADIDIPEDVGGEEAPVAEEAPAEEVVESVTLEGKPITSSTAIIWTTIDDVSSECDTIKGTLNAREDTVGVSRLEVKDSELWIYYNDDSNLNDKMIEVISVLNSTGYTYLKFNRLARSNNAIVFDITLNVQEPIKTVEEVEEEKK